MIYLICVATILMASDGVGQPAGGKTTGDVSRLVTRGLILEQVEGQSSVANSLFKQAVMTAGRSAAELRMAWVRRARLDTATISGLRIVTRSGQFRAYASVPESASGWIWWARTFLGHRRYDDMARDPGAFRSNLPGSAKPTHLYQAALISEKVRGNARIAIHRYREILKTLPAEEPVVALSADKLTELQ